MKADQTLIPPPPPVEAIYLKHLLMKASYFNRQERATAKTMIVRARRSLKVSVDRLSARWGVSQQVVMTVAMEHLVRSTDGVKLVDNE